MATEYTGDVVPLAAAKEYTGEVVPLAAEPSFLDTLKRQAGLTLRAVGPTAAGAAAGAAMGSVVPGVGTALGGAAGATAMGGAQLIDSLTGGDRTGSLMDYLGVPRPASSTERVVAQAVGGATGAVTGQTLASQLKNVATSPMAKSILGMFADRPAAQLVSGTLAAAGSQTAAEMGAGLLRRARRS